MDLGCGRSYPSPGCASGDTDGDRVSQLQHAVEAMDGNVRLGRAAPIRARAQPGADHLPEPPDRRPGLPRVTGSLLRSRPPVPGGALQMAVALRGFGFGCLARHNRGTRRHDDRRRRMALGHGGGNALLAVGAVSGERPQRSRYLIEQGADLGTVIDIFHGQRCRGDLPGAGIQAGVPLARGPARFGSVLLKQLLADAAERLHAPMTSCIT